MPTSYVKDPDSVLDFGFNWTDWLKEGGEDTIETYFLYPYGDITIDSHSEDTGIVTMWLSGGKVGTTCRIICRVVTSNGRTEDQTMEIRIRNKKEGSGMRRREVVFTELQWMARHVVPGSIRWVYETPTVLTIDNELLLNALGPSLSCTGFGGSVNC